MKQNSIPSIDHATKVLEKSMIPQPQLPLNKNNHRRSIIHGDATIQSTLEKDTIDLIVTSPPYNLGMEYSGDASDDDLDYQEYLRFSERWLSNCYLWTRPTGRLCLNVGLDKNKGGKRPVCADLTRIAMKLDIT